MDVFQPLGCKVYSLINSTQFNLTRQGERSRSETGNSNKVDSISRQVWAKWW